MPAAGTAKFGYVLFAMAKAGRADAGAVAAGQTACRDMVPAWIKETVEQGLLQAAGRQLTELALSSLADLVRRVLNVPVISGLQGQ